MERMILTSDAFYDGTKIPEKYASTKKGQNYSPPLNWTNAPSGTVSFSIIAEDVSIPFIGKITHWVIYNIPGAYFGLRENPPDTKFIDGIIQGKNIYFKNAYLGPDPISGSHEYIFTIYALDCMIDKKNATAKALLKLMENHILDSAKLSGFYSKK